MQDRERACRCIASPPTSTLTLQDALGAFNWFPPHDDISVLERSQIPENDKGANRQRQILLPSGSLTPFFFGMPTLAGPLWLAIRLLASGHVEQGPGPQRKRQLIGLVGHVFSNYIYIGAEASIPVICSLVR